MKRSALLAPAFLVLVVAGCGGSSYGGGSSTSSSSKPAAASSATLASRSSSLGTILVGANGRTLYLFEKDKGPTSTCDGGCAGVWTPFTTTGKPKAGAGVDSAKLTTSKRADAKEQVVYGGHPLYYYVSDTKAGDTKGQNLNQFGADWYVVSPTAQKVEKSSSSQPSSSAYGSGYR
jgi:predicted lipoprotein with Yx(FWY)xxD motif